jgi:hypothetical protein
MFRSSFFKGVFIGTYCLFVLTSGRAAFADEPVPGCFGCNDCDYRPPTTEDPHSCAGDCKTVQGVTGDCSDCDGCADPVQLFDSETQTYFWHCGCAS